MPMRPAEKRRKFANLLVSIDRGKSGRLATQIHADYGKLTRRYRFSRAGPEALPFGTRTTGGGNTRTADHRPFQQRRASWPEPGRGGTHHRAALRVPYSERQLPV